MAVRKLDSRAPASKTAADLHKCVSLWNKLSPGAVSAMDVPPAADVGGKAAMVRLVLRGRKIEFSCSSQANYTLNLRACYLAVDGMRNNEARGIGDTMAQAYAMLAAPQQTRDPYEVLGLRPGADAALVEAAYKAKARQAHSDLHGGSSLPMQELNTARDELLARLA